MRLLLFSCIIAAVTASGCSVEFIGGPVPDGGPGCGNGVLEADEVCDGTDFGNQTCNSAVHHESGQLACTDDCALDVSDCHTCGDGAIDGPETCDDENITADDGCSPRCQVDPGWVCTGVPSTCVRTCGDSVIEGTETCDDGNWAEGDGCSLLCRVESGWTCAGEPSVCTPICSDGRVLGTETCDDGNNDGGDGCGADCQTEGHYACSGEPSECVCVVYVDLESPAGPNGNGGSWAQAFTSVQEGIDLAADPGMAQLGCEVWVSEGTYHIYDSAVSDTVILRQNVPVYGGFSGVETARVHRDWQAHATVLDGRHATVPNVHVNHVVSANNITEAVLDGFIVTYGQAATDGGGMYAVQSAVTVSNCRFEHNTAAGSGGGLYLQDCSDQVLVQDTTFTENSATDGGGVSIVRGEPMIRRCTFLQNSAAGYGGGLDCFTCLSPVRRCGFEGNTADYGGGLASGNGTMDVVSCVFFNNQALRGGGVNFNTGGSHALRNCTFHSNTASAEGGGIRMNNTTVAVANSILWADSPDEISCDTCTETFSYCDVQGGWAGTAILNANPLFVDAAAGDLHLQSGSSCIDAGHGDWAPVIDFEGFSRADDPNTPDTGTGTPTYTDLGAYEYQP